ncbi:SNF2-related protein [Derxia lacustris]|uniref:SNF2-related protein n=1 Tax=Derxia lacustris TaxID=764842 RepID=UPI000A1770DF|nr:SNF2-related protein [Derxia lacustris]
MPATMQYSPHQLAYFASKLTLKAPADSIERMTGALLDAQVDLNPHQIDAALFATANPLSRGVILADEVGLGKTIEAGLLIAQRWAERRRRILVIVPANLRKQWHQELADKFGLPAIIVEATSYKKALADGVANPFEQAAAPGAVATAIVICSYQFAAGKAADVARVPWDLVVVDEAHRLRNVYKPENKTANTLRDALAHAPKVFLTATPLQNTLLELFGLVSFIDDLVFGDLDSFRQQFGNARDAGNFAELQRRLAPICKRTLRREVEAYVKYTRRIPVRYDFKPSSDEATLYELVSAYLQRERLFALPNSQRQLITLVLRKLLSSSTFAIAGALDTLVNRLRRTLGERIAAASELGDDYESFDATADEFGIANLDDSRPQGENEIAAIRAEIVELEAFRDLAVSITDNAKGAALLTALKAAFERLDEMGAARKAIVFTESRRTQSYLLNLLGQTEHAGHVVLFNGSNSDGDARRIHAEWLARHRGTDRVSNSRTADTRAALVDWFREQGSIMIATEAGAEGINLQFCSLVINYDLPWNPQRIEQRIGRCHRYGQKHDVVVVNFLNLDNQADVRVFELLDQKFRLFDGVFGVSDEVLGAIESGVDFERRIADIYQRCRHPDDIDAAFAQLRHDLAGEIDAAMLDARRALLEHFDEDVQQRLRVTSADASASLDRMERLLMRFTRAMLDGRARFDADGLAFTLPAPLELVAEGVAEPGPGVPAGRYELPRRNDDAHVYRLQHPLAQGLLAAALRAPLPPARLHLDYAAYGSRVDGLLALRGSGGSVVVERLTIAALGTTEDYLLIAAEAGGQPLDAELCEKLLALPGQAEPAWAAAPVPAALRASLDARRSEIEGHVETRNLDYFAAETDKLDAWADDLRFGLEREIKELDRRIKEARTRGRSAATLAEKLAFQKEQRELEAQRDKKRRELFVRQDEIQRERDRLIDDLEAQLDRRVTLQALFACEWRID